MPILNLIAPEANEATSPLQLSPKLPTDVSAKTPKSAKSEGPDMVAKSAEQGGDVEAFLLRKTDAKSWLGASKKSLTQLGLDSLDVVQVRNAFQKEFKAQVPLSVFSKPNQSLQDLRRSLQENLALK